jgi:hypothetical protein
LAAISVFAPSRITILLNAVYDDQLVEFTDLSAEILIQLFAAVTATLKCVDSNTTYGAPPINITFAVV